MEASVASPREMKATPTTTAGSRDLSLAALSGLVTVKAVEYPTGLFPPSYIRFNVWSGTLTILVSSAPSGGQGVNVYYGAMHTLDASSSTLPVYMEDLVATGAAAYAALEWASFATNRINVGGEDVWRQYLVWGQDRMAGFMRRLSQLSRKNAVRARSIYVPAQPGPSQTSNWGA